MIDGTMCLHGTRMTGNIEKCTKQSDMPGVNGPENDVLHHFRSVEIIWRGLEMIGTQFLYREHVSIVV